MVLVVPNIEGFSQNVAQKWRPVAIFIQQNASRSITNQGPIPTYQDLPSHPSHGTINQLPCCQGIVGQTNQRNPEAQPKRQRLGTRPVFVFLAGLLAICVRWRVTNKNRESKCLQGSHQHLKKKQVPSLMVWKNRRKVSTQNLSGWNAWMLQANPARASFPPFLPHWAFSFIPCTSQIQPDSWVTFLGFPKMSLQNPSSAHRTTIHFFESERQSWTKTYGAFFGTWAF